jgi:hypothetical protein
LKESIKILRNESHLKPIAEPQTDKELTPMIWTIIVEQIMSHVARYRDVNIFSFSET